MESLTVNDLPQFPRREMELTWPLCGIDYVLTGFDFHFLHVIFFLSVKSEKLLAVTVSKTMLLTLLWLSRRVHAWL